MTSESKLVDAVPEEVKSKKLGIDEEDTTMPGKPIIEEVGSELAKKKKRKVDDKLQAPKDGDAICE